MKTIIGALGIIHGCATLAFVFTTHDTGLALIGVFQAMVVALLIVYGWRYRSFVALVATTLLTALAVSLASYALLADKLGLWPAVAFVAAVGGSVAVLVQTARAWNEGTPMQPIEVAVLRNKYTLTMHCEQGPSRVVLPFYEELFACLPLLPLHITHCISDVDVTPRGEQGAQASQQVRRISVEASFRLRADATLAIFDAPNLRLLVGKGVESGPQIRSFLEGLRDHAVWETVYTQLIVQQIDSLVRRGAYAAQLHPHQLSAKRADFAEAVKRALGHQLQRYGMELIAFDVVQIDTAESAAAQQGRVYEAVAEAELRARSQQLQTAMQYIRKLGLAETPEMIEMVLLQLSGAASHVSLIRSRDGGPKLVVPEQPAADERAAPRGPRRAA